MLGQLVCGSLVDRIGGRVTLVAAMVVAAVVLCALAASHSTPMLVGGAVVFGLAFDAPRPIISAAIAELIPDSGTSQIDAFRYGWVVNAGGAITGALGGLLAVRIGVPAPFLIRRRPARCSLWRRCGSCRAMLGALRRRPLCRATGTRSPTNALSWCTSRAWRR